MTSPTTLDLAQYKDKRVTVQVRLAEPNEKGETLIEVEGKVEAGSDIGLLIKPKGRTQVELIEADSIEDVVFAPEAPKKIQQKVLLPVEAGRVRQHLVDRHGISMSDVSDMTEEAAESYHNGLDHEDLGHVHQTKEEQEKEKAGSSEEAEAAASADSGDDE